MIDRFCSDSRLIATPGLRERHRGPGRQELRCSASLRPLPVNPVTLLFPGSLPIPGPEHADTFHHPHAEGIPVLRRAACSYGYFLLFPCNNWSPRPRPAGSLICPPDLHRQSPSHAERAPLPRCRVALFSNVETTTGSALSSPACSASTRIESRDGSTPRLPRPAAGSAHARRHFEDVMTVGRAKMSAVDVSTDYHGTGAAVGELQAVCPSAAKRLRPHRPALLQSVAPSGTAISCIVDIAKALRRRSMQGVADLTPLPPTISPAGGSRLPVASIPTGLSTRLRLTTPSTTRCSSLASALRCRQHHCSSWKILQTLLDTESVRHGARPSWVSVEAPR